VLIVINQDYIIESRIDHEPESPGLQGGVRLRPVREALREVMRLRCGTNDTGFSRAEQIRTFQIRRWHRRSVVTSTYQAPKAEGSVSPCAVRETTHG